MEWVEPTSLPGKIDLQPSKSGESHESLLRLLAAVIRYSVKTGHPHFVNQLYSSVDPYGLVGQWLTDALNPSVYTYEVSPVFSLMEETILREMRAIVGWPVRTSISCNHLCACNVRDTSFHGEFYRSVQEGEGDGIFCPGGSMANGYAINLARHWMFPALKEQGLAAAPRLVVFTSEDAHYSVKKLAAFLGIGTGT